MSGVAAPARVNERARVAAEAAAVGRLLNIYARESGTGLRTADDEPVPAEVEAAEGRLAPGGQLAWVRLPATGAVLVAPLANRSAIGHHRLAGPVWRVPAGGTAATVVESAPELAAALAAELLVAHGAPAHHDDVDENALETIRHEVASSIDRCTRYVADRLADAERVHPVEAPDPAVAAEATLAFGHPFHPSPKLADGFSPDDTDDYAPELSHGFPLWWIAAPRDLVTEENLPAADPPPIPPDVTATARARLGPGRSSWQLLPCHPWQARALTTRDDLAGALDDGTIRLLGPLGPDVRPTSSVRTVRQPDGSFWKLSLDVRITNFVRHNTPEQVRRTLDAGRIVTALPPRLRSGRLEILPDTAYRALALPGADELTTATAVLHRPAPGPAPGPPPGATPAPAGPLRGSAGATPPMVVAGLVEPDPRDGVPALARLLAAAAGAADVPVDRIGRRWLRAYLRISLRPLLRLLLDQGISFEAHTQNSLAGFAGGWPSRLVVRDLEGTSVDRTHPLAAAHRRLLGSDDSPVLYSPEDAWQRFAYYVVVNHIGQVVATVAAETNVDEEELWAEVAALVRAEAAAASGPPADHLRAALLGPHLPAKANLISRLLGRSETPVYVDIPNPCAAT